MATKKTPDQVEAVVLCNCVFGNVGEVVTLTPGEADTGTAIGVIDVHPDAIKAAKAE
jgi:hypothetical protein